MTHNDSNSNSLRSPSSPPSIDQQPPSLPPSIPTFLLGSHVINMPLHGQPFYSSPVWNGPVHQGTVQQQQYRPPSSGPSRSQRGGGRHSTGAQDRNQFEHASAGTTTRDRSDSNNAGTGGASRPPSRHPSTASSPYGRRSGASWTRRHTEDISAQQVPNMDLGRGWLKTRIMIRSHLGQIPNSVIEGAIFSMRFKFFNPIDGRDLSSGSDTE
ncbi:hypothetical protein BYT27DRAFT_7203145 [Phlegmacium glaucopus]|nr:hypothetical protein BYT27DRAFT_7203145 [Phlegmacium glaucopus]